MSRPIESDTLHQFFESSLDMLCVAGTDGYFKVLNPAWEQTLGYSRSELLGQPYLEFVHADDRDRTIREASGLAEGKPTVSFENRYRCQDGSYKWLFWKSVPVGTTGQIFAIAHDITERKVQEEEIAALNAGLERRVQERTQALEESQRTLKNLLSNLPGMAYRCRNDQDWTMEYVSEGARDLTGCAPGDLLHNRVLSYAALILPEDRGTVAIAVEAALESKSPFEIEYRIVTSGGETRWVWEQGRGVYAVGGELLHLEGLVIDITERKRAEQTVQRQARLIDEARDGIFVRDMDGRIEFWSKGAERIFGRPAEDVLGKPAVEVLPWGSSADFEKAMQATVEKGEWNGQFQGALDGGREIAVESRWSLLRGKDGEPAGALTIATDITERKRLEEQLLRAQRLESVGTLASGIAHDLNNALTPILMAVQVLQRKYPDTEQRTLEMLESAAKRGARLVKQVLTFGRGIAGEPILLDVRHRINDFKTVVEQTFPSSIRMHLDVPSELWAVLADPTQIDQVIMNLAVNARDAMPDGGTLTVRAKNVTLDETYIRMQIDAVPGPYVQIEVADTGQGMPPGVRDRIFEPFFTTKDVTKGTGLGLSTVHTIVKNHGGFVNVYSEVGRGATFRVYLPAADGEAAQAVEKRKATSLRGDGRRILVADDDLLVREMVASLLEDAGYRVAGVENGADAVARYAQGGIDVALIDWEMPVMNGRQTIQAIRQINPDARIIACSGISHVAEISTLDAPVPFLPKPYTAEDLMGKLAGLAGDRAPQGGKEPS